MAKEPRVCPMQTVCPVYQIDACELSENYEYCYSYMAISKLRKDAGVSGDYDETKNKEQKEK